MIKIIKNMFDKINFKHQHAYNQEVAKLNCLYA